MENNLKKCIESLFDSLNSESEIEALNLFGKAIEYAKNSDTDIKDPEIFDLYVNHKIDRGIELLANTLHEPSISKNKHKPNFIYKNYKFLESHIRELCILREGHSCCADKSRHILNMYMNYSINGNIPEFNPNDENFYFPNFGDYKMWIEFCDSLYKLYYGHTKEYFKSYNDLIQCEIRKYKHILHRWNIELYNGTTFEFYQSWDNYNENPLEDFFDKGDFYIMHKRKVKDMNFHIYEPTNKDEKLLYKNYVQIPKSKVKQIYKTSEELFV